LVATYPVVFIRGCACELTRHWRRAMLAPTCWSLNATTVPRGTTAMPTGRVPAAGTPDQSAAGITDSAGRLTDDIVAKAGGGDLAVIDRPPRQQGRCRPVGGGAGRSDGVGRAARLGTHDIEQSHSRQMPTRWPCSRQVKLGKSGTRPGRTSRRIVGPSA